MYCKYDYCDIKHVIVYICNDSLKYTLDINFILKCVIQWGRVKKRNIAKQEVELMKFNKVTWFTIKVLTNEFYNFFLGFYRCAFKW